MRVAVRSWHLGQLPAELERLGISRALILSRPIRKTGREVAAMLGDRAAGIFAQAEMHTPVGCDRTRHGMRQRTSADGVVAIGGGSTTGLGKAIALRTDSAADRGADQLCRFGDDADPRRDPRRGED